MTDFFLRTARCLDVNLTVQSQHLYINVQGIPVESDIKIKVFSVAT